MPDLLMSETQLTVQQLLDYLQKLVKNDPNMKDAKVCHAEFGAISPSHTIYTTNRVDTYNDNKEDTVVVLSGN